MKKLTIETLRESNLIAYEYIRGSTLYGLNTPTSDIDVGGVYIAPIENILGLPKHYQEQVSDERSDVTFYEVSKWLDLLIKSNPNALESLFIPKDKVIGEIHPAIQLIIDNRDMFVTKECFKPFLGYAIEQIKKARGLNKKIVNPVTERKTILDFCYTTYNQGSSNIQNWLAYRGLKQEYCGLVAISNMRDFYGVYYDWGMHKDFLEKTNAPDETKKNLVYKGVELGAWPEPLNVRYQWDNIPLPIGYKGIAKISDEETKTKESNEVRLSSVEKGVMPICHMAYNKDGYVTHCKDYREYKEWEKNRNPVRYESNLNKNYDCYLDEETEFLTKNGWKKYDEINDSDLLGCFGREHNIEYSPFINRVDDLYTGEIYTYESPYIRYSVTPNHKLYLSPCHRTRYNNFSTKYKEETSKWTLIPIKNYFNEKRSYYHQLQHLKNLQNDDVNYSDDFIKLLGMFLSEGCYVFNNKSEIPTGIRISQLANGRVCDVMDTITSIKISKYHYNKRKNRCEITWECNDKDVLKLIQKCNGRYSTEKDIPSYVYNFSKRQFDLLVTTMLCGDGTYHKVNGHSVYYTYSQKMAKSLHTLLSLNGYNAQMYGGDSGYKHSYPSNFKRKDGIVNGSYHIFISKYKEQYHVVTKTNHWEIRNVENKRIVCFETKYGTLITRNNNKIAFHGNSKNLCHTVRLMHMGIEIARGQGFNVVRDWDRDFLMKIRNHEYEYDYLINYVDQKKIEIEEAIAKSTLPETVDETFVQDLLIQVRKLSM